MMSNRKVEGIENRLGLVFQFCAAFYLGLWYSSIVPAMLASGAMSYHIAGWAGFAWLISRYCHGVLIKIANL